MISVVLLHPCIKLAQLRFEGSDASNFTLPDQTGWSAYFNDFDCGGVFQYDQILSVVPQQAYSEYIEQNLQILTDSLSIENTEIQINLTSKKFAGFYEVTVGIILADHQKEGMTSGNYTTVIEIYDECSYLQIQAEDSEPFMYSFLDYLPLNFVDQEIEACGSLIYSEFVVKSSQKVYKILEEPTLYIEDTIKDNIINEFGTYANTELFIEYNITLQSDHLLYKRHFT